MAFAPTLTESPPDAFCERIARVASVFAFGVGLAVLSGWGLEFRPLTTVLPGFVAMMPNTAVGICASGLSLFLFLLSSGPGRRMQSYSVALSAAVVLLGALTLVEYVTGTALGIDELLFADYTASASDNMQGRMSPITAVNFVLLGLALIPLHLPAWRGWSHGLAMVVALSSMLAIVGYFFGVIALYKVGNSSAIAVHTAAVFLALCVGIWCATSSYGFMQVVTGSGPSGMLVRRAGLIVIVLPFFFTWLRLRGENNGWFGPEFGAAIIAISYLAVFSTLIAIGGRSLRTRELMGALVQDQLRKAQQELEARVLARTRELAAANENLKVQMAHRAKLERAQATILDHSLDAICTFDEDGRFVQVSRACESLWGYRPEELIGRAYLEMVHPDDQAMTIEVARGIMRGVPVTNFENRYLCKNGVAVPIVWTANWSEAEQSMFCVARDITIRKQFEDELRAAKEAAEAANRSKSEFLANMSHEIRTPMNGIIGMTELVLDTPLKREQREYLSMAKSSAHSLLALINNILDFSKIEAGKMELESVAFSLRDCLGMMLKSLGMRADQKGIELTADIPSDVPDHVVGDPLRLRQILLNLVDNAIKFTEQGEVMLRVAVESVSGAEHCLHFSIADTGIGIRKEKQAIIFDAFAQADGTTTRQYGGTGLGLAIAVQLVRQMGGRIWVESNPGEGTTFHFTAQLASQPSPAPNTRSKSTHTLVGLRALVVDNNAANRRILHETLLQWQMRPETVASGGEALDELRRAAREGTPFPLVLLDGLMPEMDGFMVAEKIREDGELSGATVMMLSSIMPAGTAARCIELGVARYLIKPVTQSELLEAILLALGGAAESVPALPAPFDNGARPLRILLVEDNLINRAVAQSILKKRGHSVVHAANGCEAVTAAAAELFDLIFMDVQMPDMDGFEATRRIRANELATGRHTPIVAMTAHAMVGDRERCLASGMDDYLSKPLRKSELMALLTRVRGAGSSKTPTARPALPVEPGSAKVEPPIEATLPPIFSRVKLLEQLDGDEILLQRMSALFRENTPCLLEDIRSSIARRSSDGLTGAAHALLSSVGAFGANEAHRLARCLEELGQRAEFVAAEQTCSELDAEMKRVGAALEDLAGSEA